MCLCNTYVSKQKKVQPYLGSYVLLCNVSSTFSQNRNVHGKIFGGYLMKKAFELAWVTAVSECKFLL